jgi:hypothetical protein
MIRRTLLSAMTALILGCGSSGAGTTMGADDASNGAPNTRVRQDATAGADDLTTPLDPTGSGGTGGSNPGHGDAAQPDPASGGAGGNDSGGDRGDNNGGVGGGNSGGGNGQGGVLGTGGVAQGGSSGSGGTTPRPDASTIDTRPIDGGTRPDATVSYPACKDIDILTSTTPCSRPGDVRKLEWARKDGYRCAVCGSTRGLIGEQQSGCLKPAPSNDAEPEQGPYLCVVACKECVY